MADCTYYADRIVIPYQPRLIVVRAGGNDIAAGKTPERVRDNFRAFAEKVRAKLPTVRIAYMTINATPSRWANVEQEKKTNQLIKEYISAGDNLDYIDTFDATMSDGKPRPELFVKDRLHFNAAGYKILAACVRSHLAEAPVHRTAVDAAAKPSSDANGGQRDGRNPFTAAQRLSRPFPRCCSRRYVSDATGPHDQNACLLGGRARVEGPLRIVRGWASIIGEACAPYQPTAACTELREPVTVEKYHGDNPFYRHGPLRVAADHRHFEHADGTPFFWLADTWWMGLTSRLHWPQEFQELAADRKAKGFDVIQIVAGIYPDMPAFDPRGANEAGFPWEKDYKTIRPEYFDKADQRLIYLADQGFSPCIVAPGATIFPGWASAHEAALALT